MTSVMGAAAVVEGARSRLSHSTRNGDTAPISGPIALQLCLSQCAVKCDTLHLVGSSEIVSDRSSPAASSSSSS